MQAKDGDISVSLSLESTREGGGAQPHVSRWRVSERERNKGWIMRF